MLSLQYVDASLGYSGGLVGYLNVGINSNDTQTSGGATTATTAATTGATGATTTTTTASSASGAAVYAPALLALFLFAALSVLLNA